MAIVNQVDTKHNIHALHLMEGIMHNTTERLTPVSVSNLAGVTAIASRFCHTCAISDGAAKCWGQNDVGQLGDGTTTQRTSPVDVSGLSGNVTAITTGRRFSCAVQSGGVKCWGTATYGQLGNGGYTDHATPVSVSRISAGVAELSGGFYHTCAELSDGSVQCWGYNPFGQLGEGQFGYVEEARQIYLENAYSYGGESAPPYGVSRLSTGRATMPTAT